MRTIVTAALLALTAGGCSSPNSQLVRCQEDKEQLLATIREQRDGNRALRDEVASLETRLDEAEKDLARSAGTTRLSSRPSDAARPPVKTEPLPWRSPPPSPASPPAKSGAAIRSNDHSLATLAQRDRRLHYDAHSRAALLDAAIVFEENTAALTAEDKRQLDEVARLLKSDEARQARVMIAGYAAGRPSTTAPTEDEPRYTSARQLAAARAQAVADYLDRHGIAQERLGVTGVGAPQGKLAGSRGGVEIFLLEPEAVVVGWGPSGRALR
jgi:outer membrane protein OmpA-like peptidoglycan-associated protein